MSFTSFQCFIAFTIDVFHYSIHYRCILIFFEAIDNGIMFLIFFLSMFIIDI
jgi:hypothetical protein